MSVKWNWREGAANLCDVVGELAEGRLQPFLLVVANPLAWPFIVPVFFLAVVLGTAFLVVVACILVVHSMKRAAQTRRVPSPKVPLGGIRRTASGALMRAPATEVLGHDSEEKRAA